MISFEVWHQKLQENPQYSSPLLSDQPFCPTDRSGPMIEVVTSQSGHIRERLPVLYYNIS